MPRLNHLLITAGLVALPMNMLPSPAAAQSGPFADHAALDAAIESFTGAPIGRAGGARAGVDRRLRLARCGEALSLSWHGRSQEMVKVECSDGAGWRFFVPVQAVAVSAAAATAAATPVVERGQVLTIALEGRGFTVTQQGEAMEEGTIGDWIRVRPEGNREAVRARIDNPGRVVIPLG